MNAHGNTALVARASKESSCANYRKLARKNMQRLVLMTLDREQLAKTTFEVRTFGVAANLLSLDKTREIDVDI